jgi:hypothetical protein
MKNAKHALFHEERARFHSELLSKILSINDEGVPSNADKTNITSKKIALGIFRALNGQGVSTKESGQTKGSKFEQFCANFIKRTFSHLAHLRPGKWEIRNGKAIANFAQYAHLGELRNIAKATPLLSSVLGNDYVIAPDIIIVRHPEPDEYINTPNILVDEAVARRTDIRAINNTIPILHASISCKWTLRSDRAQNSRSEALNLIRNRKGRLPHIVVITGEPLPSRIASIALGTGDIDCVYHFALPELISSATDGTSSDLLNIMISGKRLRDIADLPFDLAA